MFSKNQILENLEKDLQSKQISAQEVYSLLTKYEPSLKNLNSDNKSIPELTPQKNYLKFNFGQLMSYIGGLIILAGIIFIISLNWNSLDDSIKIFVTLGSGIVAFIMGNLLVQSLDKKYIGNSFHVMGGFLIPTGIIVLLSILFPTPPDNILLIIANIFLALYTIYLIASLIFKQGVLILIATIFATIAYGFLYLSIREYFKLFWFELRLEALAALILGVSYLLVGYFLDFRNKPNFIASLIFHVGVILSLVSLFSFVSYDKYSTSQLYHGHQVLELLFGSVFVLTFYVASKIQSNFLAFTGSVGLIAWLLYLNSKYFTEYIGWPVSLIISGIIIILVSSISWKRFGKNGKIVQEN